MYISIYVYDNVNELCMVTGCYHQGYVVLEVLILFVEVCMNMITCEFRGQGPAGMPSALYCMDRC